mgnify:CR=1 FL=1|jgi:hypothetical protein|tara:strand:- start:695 stop:979 length:285 start_codon:yes stop_codon:yes gene_type:complete
MARSRNSYKVLNSAKFYDQQTGAYCKLNDSCWFLKKLENKTHYFLNTSHNQFQEMPKACFEATAARSKEHDFTSVQQQINNFDKEVNSENNNKS